MDLSVHERGANSSCDNCSDVSRICIDFSYALAPSTTNGFLGALEILGESNIAAAVVASAFILCLIAVLLDKIIWPIIARLVYPLIQFKVVHNRKLMATIGLLCLPVAFPKLIAWVGPLEKLAHLLF